MHALERGRWFLQQRLLFLLPVGALAPTPPPPAVLSSSPVRQGVVSHLLAKAHGKLEQPPQLSPGTWGYVYVCVCTCACVRVQVCAFMCTRACARVCECTHVCAAAPGVCACGVTHWNRAPALNTGTQTRVRTAPTCSAGLQL